MEVKLLREIVDGWVLAKQLIDNKTYGIDYDLGDKWVNIHRQGKEKDPKDNPIIKLERRFEANRNWIKIIFAWNYINFYESMHGSIDLNEIDENFMFVWEPEHVFSKINNLAIYAMNEEEVIKALETIEKYFP